MSALHRTDGLSDFSLPGSTRPLSARRFRSVLRAEWRRSTQGERVRPRGSARRAVARARRRSAAAFVLVAGAVGGLFLVAVPGSTERSSLLPVALFAMGAGALSAVVTERWSRSQFVDLRHHDLLEGLRRGPAPDVVDLTDGPTVASARTHAQDTGAGTHRLFGECACPDCADGRTPVQGASSEGGATSVRSARQVVDLRSGAGRAGRVRLGQRRGGAG